MPARVCTQKTPSQTQCSAEVLEKWGQMIHHTGNVGTIPTSGGSLLLYWHYWSQICWDMGPYQLRHSWFYCAKCPHFQPRHNTADYRRELPLHVVLTANDYEITLARFTYPHIASQLPTAIFTFQAGHLHQHPPVGGCGDIDDDGVAATAAAAGGDRSPPAHPCQGTTSSRAAGPCPPDTTRTSDKSLMIWTAMAAGARWHSSSAFTPPRTASWWPSTHPGRLHGQGDAYTATVPASGLAGPEDGAPGPGQHTPHGPIHTRFSETQCRACKCTVASIITWWATLGITWCGQDLWRGTSVRSCVMSPGGWIGCPCTGQSSSMCTWL